MRATRSRTLALVAAIAIGSLIGSPPQAESFPPDFKEVSIADNARQRRSTPQEPPGFLGPVFSINPAATAPFNGRLMFRR
jgi:hypothetical protein